MPGWQKKVSKETRTHRGETQAARKVGDCRCQCTAWSCLNELMRDSIQTRSTSSVLLGPIPQRDDREQNRAVSLILI